MCFNLGEIVGVLTLQHNFSDALQERYLADADNTTASESQIRLYMDMSNYAVATSIYHSILRTFEKFQKHMTRINELSGISSPMQVERYVYGSEHPTYLNSQVPGVVVAFIVLSPMFMAIYITVSEKQDGLLDRSLVLGVNGLEAVLAIILTQLLFLVVPTILMLLIVFWGFAVPLEGSIVHVFFLTYLQGVAATALGLLISAIFDDFIPAFICVAGTIFPTWILSGIFWPRLSINSYLQHFAYMWPLRLPAESMFHVVSRGWGLEHFEVVIGYISSVAFILIYLVPAIFIFKKFTNS